MGGVVGECFAVRDERRGGSPPIVSLTTCKLTLSLASSSGVHRRFADFARLVTVAPEADEGGE